MSETERWTVWCEHADGRQYRMGDSTQTRWSRATAERIAAHMRANEPGNFEAQKFVTEPSREAPRVDKEAVLLVHFMRFCRAENIAFSVLSEAEMLLVIERYREST